MMASFRFGTSSAMFAALTGPRSRWVCLLLALGGCGPGLFTDGSSISVGTFNSGLLRRGRKLPAQGEGYVVPPLWAARDASWGTDEIVGAIQRAGRRVNREYPGSTFGVGDLSLRGGGRSVLHRSHENGRDADLIYFAIDERGKPVAPVDSMPRYFGDLKARAPTPQEHGVVFGPFSPRQFDVPRNWALVRALLLDPHVEVQYLFVNRRLKDRMIDHARALGEDPALVDRAEALLHQPGDSAPHDDHLHVRIFCAQDDRPYGCNDRGPVRWWKKRYKYMPPVWRRDALEGVAGALAQLVGAQRAILIP